MKVLILKELRAHATDFKLLFLVPLVIVLSYFSTRINSKEYVNTFQSNEKQLLQSQDELKKVPAYCLISIFVPKKESPLSVLCQGDNPFLGKSILIRLSSYSFFADQLNFRSVLVDNPYLNHLFRLDLIHIILYFLSLIALLLGYDAISREKENGTLQLLVTTGFSVPRLYLAKFLSAIVLLLLVLSLCFISAIAAMIQSKIHISVPEFLKIVVLFIASFWFVFFWLALGQYLSLWAERSSRSLFVSMLVWCFLLFAIPAAERILFGNPYILMDESGQAAREKSEEFWNKLETVMESESNAFKNGAFSFMQFNEYIGAASSLLFTTRVETYQRNVDILRFRWNTSFLASGLWKRIEDKSSFMALVGNVEPGGIFLNIGKALCETQLSDHFRYLHSVRHYGEQIDQSLNSYHLYENPRWFTPIPFVHPLIKEIERVSKDGKRTKETERLVQLSINKLFIQIKEAEKRAVETSMIPVYKSEGIGFGGLAASVLPLMVILVTASALLLMAGTLISTKITVQK